MSVVKKFKSENNNLVYAKKTIAFCVIAITFLLLIQIWVAHTTTTSGEKLKEIENLQKVLELENQMLENEISATSSLNNIATQAASLGLKPPKSIQYIR